MLDQNTDRMWYVIGAVIIGAALIFIMNATFPQLFASIGDTFESKTEEVTKEVEQLTLTDGTIPISRNLLNLSELSAQINRDEVKHGGGATYGYVYQGIPNTSYTLSTDIVKRQVDFVEYAYEYDLFITTPEFDSPGSVINGVAINEPRTVVTDESGALTIWFRIPSAYRDRTSYPSVLDGTYRVQLEKGNVATEYVAY